MVCWYMHICKYVVVIVPSPLYFPIFCKSFGSCFFVLLLFYVIPPLRGVLPWCPSILTVYMYKICLLILLQLSYHHCLPPYLSPSASEVPLPTYSTLRYSKNTSFCLFQKLNIFFIQKYPILLHISYLVVQILHLNPSSAFWFMGLMFFSFIVIFKSAQWHNTHFDTGLVRITLLCQNQLGTGIIFTSNSNSKSNSKYLLSHHIM